MYSVVFYLKFMPSLWPNKFSVPCALSNNRNCLTFRVDNKSKLQNEVIETAVPTLFNIWRCYGGFRSKFSWLVVVFFSHSLIFNVLFYLAFVLFAECRVAVASPIRVLVCRSFHFFFFHIWVDYYYSQSAFVYALYDNQVTH